ncbi:hypothetical protein ACX0HA_08150 [Flavobacterium hauense]
MITAVIDSVILGLNPDFDKQKYRFHSNFFKIEPGNETNETSYKSELFLRNHEIKTCEEELKNEIDHISKLPDNWNGFGSKKISTEVIINTLNVVSEIPPSILYYLKDNIYPSKFGTIILDWEFGGADNNIFSLEISKNSVGYFIESKGEDIKQVESLDISFEEFDNTMYFVNQDLQSLL